MLLANVRRRRAGTRRRRTTGFLPRLIRLVADHTSKSCDELLQIVRIGTKPVAPGKCREYPSPQAVMRYRGCDVPGSISSQFVTIDRLPVAIIGDIRIRCSPARRQAHS